MALALVSGALMCGLWAPGTPPVGRMARSAGVSMREDFGQMSYRELQAACKAAGLKASGKAEVLRAALLAGGVASDPAAGAEAGSFGIEEPPSDEAFVDDAPKIVAPRPAPAILAFDDGLDSLFDNDFGGELDDSDGDFENMEAVIDELDGGGPDDGLDDFFNPGGVNPGGVGFGGGGGNPMWDPPVWEKGLDDVSPPRPMVLSGGGASSTWVDDLFAEADARRDAA
eukprot:scaffold21333_cov122-Isochrysis_galbana.AAC.3